MKLSDAILLGSSAVKPTPYGVLESLPSGVHGCAFGMALYAIGVRNESEMKNLGGDKLMPDEWAWCATKANDPGLCKCNPRSDICLRLGEYRGYITHLFNEHVMRGKMTLEQLVDYVRSVEPETRTFQCPLADCTFAGTQEEVDDHQLRVHDSAEEEWDGAKTERERFNSITGRG